jgi:stearoyl-CoA desaturase (delta-9 desaturase)
MTLNDRHREPVNWPAAVMFTLSGAVALTLVPWFGLTHGYSTSAWLWFGVVLSLNELAITCGYHRLFAHASYQARPSLRLIYLLFGAMALQNSALIWSAGHRVHHQYIDDPERDPYCARRGFWFSHMGWMLRNYPSGAPDLDRVTDLKRDPLVMWQHRHYLLVAATMNIGVPLLLGWMNGELAGTFLLVGVLRLVVSHHLTFFINSLAHIVGKQPYNTENTARDNAIVALLTFGEGYHNYHHAFAHDYRNAVRWWQWDPSKWLIFTLAWLGLAKNLKRVSRFRIQRSLLDVQFRRAEKQMALQPARGQIQQLRDRLAEEYAAFRAAIESWTQLREQWVAAKRSQWERSILQSRLKEIEYLLRSQYRRMQVLQAQLR